MRVGDVVCVRGWAPWDGAIGVVERVNNYIYFRVISAHPDIRRAYSGNKLAGFYEGNLELLGHIDIEEGEKRDDRRES